MTFQQNPENMLFGKTGIMRNDEQSICIFTICAIALQVGSASRSSSEVRWFNA